MQSYRQHEFKKPRQNNLTNNLDSSMISCKSKNSFRDLNDYRSKFYKFDIRFHPIR